MTRKQLGSNVDFEYDKYLSILLSNEVYLILQRTDEINLGPVSWLCLPSAKNLGLRKQGIPRLRQAYFMLCDLASFAYTALNSAVSRAMKLGPALTSQCLIIQIKTVKNMVSGLLKEVLFSFCFCFELK